MARVQENDLLMDDLSVSEFLAEDEDNVQDIMQMGGAVSVDADEQGSEWGESIHELPGQLAVDVYETEAKLIVKARTAGVSRQDLEVTVSDNILTISGVFNSNEEAGVLNYYEQECYWGEFSRTITLPVQVQENIVEASLKDGVLTISFEKVEQKKATSIPIK
ncbi:MAG: Hsp20/alpha crystallin family protein [Candidatus Nomurabacteria bacterium]|jgi:HSP20 family protein|nr:Hsp20/alpha crystallin family protein [Candidatus Nomurabacteria bacterium]